MQAEWACQEPSPLSAGTHVVTPAKGIGMVSSEEDMPERLGPEDSPEEKPPSGGPDEDREDLRRRCRDERETMMPHETAECAGTALPEEFEREEDGGS